MRKEVAAAGVAGAAGRRTDDPNGDEDVSDVIAPPKMDDTGDALTDGPTDVAARGWDDTLEPKNDTVGASETFAFAPFNPMGPFV